MLGFEAVSQAGKLTLKHFSFVLNVKSEHEPLREPGSLPAQLLAPDQSGCWGRACPPSLLPVPAPGAAGTEERAALCLPL